MANTFENKDFIVVDKITPKYGELKRWDVVVFVPPGKSIPFIKRIIGMPGEIVRLFEGKVYICDTAGQPIQECNQLKEWYLTPWVTTEAVWGISEFIVTDWFLVFWDNRPFSTDSRKCFGFWCLSWSNYTIWQNRIIWKVFWRIIPEPRSFGHEGDRYK
jgi:signal peptidase I